MASLWGGRFEKDMDEKNTMHPSFLIRECTMRILTAVLPM